MNDLSGRRVERSDGFTYVVYPMPFGPWRPRTTMRTIAQAVEAHLGISLEEMQSESRLKRRVYARHIAMYLCTQDALTATTPKIGEFFGDRDHSTVIHARNKIAKKIKGDEALRKDIRAIRANYTDLGST